MKTKILYLLLLAAILLPACTPEQKACRQIRAWEKENTGIPDKNLIKQGQVILMDAEPWLIPDIREAAIQAIDYEEQAMQHAQRSNRIANLLDSLSALPHYDKQAYTLNKNIQEKERVQETECYVKLYILQKQINDLWSDISKPASDSPYKNTKYVLHTAYSNLYIDTPNDDIKFDTYDYTFVFNADCNLLDVYDLNDENKKRIQDVVLTAIYQTPEQLTSMITDLKNTI